MANKTWSKEREKEIAVAQKLMNDPKNYDISYGIEKDKTLIKKGISSQSKAYSIRDDLKTENTRKRNVARLDVKRKLDAGKITKAAARKILDKNSIVPKYEVVFTKKTMKPAIQKKVNKILSGK